CFRGPSSVAPVRDCDGPRKHGCPPPWRSCGPPPSASAGSPACCSARVSRKGAKSAKKTARRSMLRAGFFALFAPLRQTLCLRGHFLWEEFAKEKCNPIPRPGSAHRLIKAAHHQAPVANGSARCWISGDHHTKFSAAVYRAWVILRGPIRVREDRLLFGR